MAAFGKFLGLLIVVILAVAGVDQLNKSQAHGETLIWPVIVLVVPLIFFGWLVVRVGSLFIRRWRYDGSKGQKAFVGLLAIVLAGGGLVGYVQANVVSQRPSMQLTAALGPACRGQPVPGAGHADPSGAKINHMVVLDTEGSEHVWTGYPPIEWRPAAVDDADYVACVSAKEARTVIEVCTYSNGSDITRYAATRLVRIIEALTGVEVDHYTLKGEPRRCGQTEQRDLTELEGDVTWEMLAAKCAEWVNAGTALATTSPGTHESTPRPSTEPRPTPTATAPVQRIELGQALELGLVDATLKGDGLQSVALEMTSSSADELIVVIAAGTWFEPKRAATQSMIAIATLEVLLAPDESGTWSVDVACGKMRRDQPGDDDRFSLAAKPADGDLALLLASPGLADQPFRVKQFAIWTLTNNPARGGYAGLGTQFSVFGSGPSKEEFAAIRDLLEQAGIDPGDYRAFR